MALHPVMCALLGALLHKTHSGRDNPNARRSYATAATGTVVGRPSCLKRVSNATRTCNSVTRRSNVRAITRSPSRLKQCILVSTKLRRWWPLHFFQIPRPSLWKARSAALRTTAPSWFPSRACRSCAGVLPPAHLFALLPHGSLWCHRLRRYSRWLSAHPVVSAPEVQQALNQPQALA